MSDEEEECPACPAGIPAWVMTFADLMSLLMCFFVLLLSFSEMDVLKFKQLAGSMAEAFGVQNQIKVKDIPKGTSIIAQEFSPGRPDPTPLNEVRQFTTDVTQMSLDVLCPDPSEMMEESKGETGSEAQEQAESDGEMEGNKVFVVERLKELVEQTEDDAIAIGSALVSEIQNGNIEVETKGRRIIIRIKENGAFDSGSDIMRSEFVPIMGKIKLSLSQMPGRVSIEGHTDSIPISTGEFRSNWDLSSMRAATVAHELFRDDLLNPNRFTVSGFAETRPLVPNDTQENRAKNRRVEIVVQQGLDSDVQDDLQIIKEENPDLYKQIAPGGGGGFGMSADEIF